MKQLLILSFFFGPIIVFGQTPMSKSNEIDSKSSARVQDDTAVITSIMVYPGSRAEKTAYYLNGQFIAANQCYALS